MRNVKTKGIYLHIPFCHHFCGFCDFKRVIYSEPLFELWYKQIEKEWLYYKDELNNQTIETIYIGGGTPSMLSIEQLQKIMSLFKDIINNCKEITIEANPEDINEKWIKEILALKINRISIGVQTFDNSMLKLMQRYTNKNKIIDAINLCHNLGLDNISIDLMYGLPDQSKKVLLKDLKQAVLLPIKHISLYSLTIEDNSIWGKSGYEEADEQLSGLMLESACQYLADNNFYRYEVSNFSLDNYQSLHNQIYWHYDDFFALGYGSSGKYNDIRYDHCQSLKQYLRQDGFKREYVSEDNEDIYQNYLMMNLRLKQPFSIAKLKEEFNVDLLDNKDVLDKLNDYEYLTYDNDYIYMSDYGLDCLFNILIELL